ncbi:MAG: UDP-N-acetylmuramate dehydrogenase [Candidatus Sericytochromatia bacterium]|nr:UDP-N-acetylmuramate dehydrogenase [Candidatus Sericytochromatia bacterium]
MAGPSRPIAPPPGGVRSDVALAPFTTWQVGGPARWFLEPSTVEEVQAALAWACACGIPWRPLGRGSNVLVADEGYHGLVIRLGSGFSQVSVQADEGQGLARAQAGVPCAQFVVACSQAGYGGLEPLVGVPGTMGGAVAMNASAHGKAVSEGFVAGRVVRADGTLETWQAEAFAFRYRHTRLHDEGVLFLDGTWRLEPVALEEARSRIRELQRWRHEKQPTNLPSGGSTFRNPGEGRPAAGALIEQVGGKGLRRGGAEVSVKHANFIVNRGGATAADINGLIVTLQERVQTQFGVKLVPEVMGLGMHVGTD